MRRSTRRRFETYRKQTRTLTFGDEARDETMRIIRALRAEQAQREAAAAEAPAVAPMATKTASPTPKPRKRPSWIGARAPFALRAAACAVVAVGVALFAVVGIAPTVDREHNIATASSPLLPYRRIQFDTDNEVGFDSGEGIYEIVPVHLSLPGTVPDGNITLTVCNSNGVLFEADELSDNLGGHNVPQRLQCIRGKVSLFASFLTDITPSEFAEGAAAPIGWIWDPTYVIELIERLRNCKIIVDTDDGQRFVFTIDFDDFPTRQDISDRLYSKAGHRLVYFPLNESEA